jgi:hypothetical protein
MSDKKYSVNFASGMANPSCDRFAAFSGAPPAALRSTRDDVGRRAFRSDDSEMQRARLPDMNAPSRRK